MTGFKLDASPIARALSAERARRGEAALGAGRALAARMEAYAKANRRWEDRTGRARGAIHGRAKADGARIRIELTGEAPYSAALEAAYGGRYAILGPTVRRFAPELMRALAEEVGG